MQELPFFPPTSPPFLGILLSFIVRPVLDNSLLSQNLCGYFQIQKRASLCCVYSDSGTYAVQPRKSPGHLFWWGRFQTLGPSLRSNQKSRTGSWLQQDRTQPA